MCVLPWDVGNTWTSYTAPLKVREYLATGKPVVIAQLAEFEQMQDILRLARNRDDFLNLVEDALNERGNDLAPARQSSVANLTWDAHAEWVSNLIEKEFRSQKKIY